MRLSVYSVPAVVQGWEDIEFTPTYDVTIGPFFPPVDPPPPPPSKQQHKASTRAKKCALPRNFYNHLSLTWLSKNVLL